MDGLVFYKLMRILRSILLKSRLNKVTVEDDFVYFSFYKDGVINLEYRAAPSPPIISPCQNISGINPGALSALQGAAVTDIGTFGYERCGFIEVKKRKASGKLSGYKLILEPAGNYANFLLLNDENIILYSLSSRTIDPDRNIGAGGKFSLPKANKRYGLNNFEGAKSFNGLSGFYPVTAACADALLKNHSFGAVCAFIKENLDNDDKFY
ncbi:MAG: NFACT family protein, partial [Mucispirillum sp.]|nr:NFACT family protein [Mucispirillum sp.]